MLGVARPRQGCKPVQSSSVQFSPEEKSKGGGGPGERPSSRCASPADAAVHSWHSSLPLPLPLPLPLRSQHQPPVQQSLPGRRGPKLLTGAHPRTPAAEQARAQESKRAREPERKQAHDKPCVPPQAPSPKPCHAMPPHHSSSHAQPAAPNEQHPRAPEDARFTAPVAPVAPEMLLAGSPLLHGMMSYHIGKLSYHLVAVQTG